MADNNDKPAPFDANQAMQAIKDKIKSAFVELIPDEQWSEMVKKEVDDFFKVKEERFQSEGNAYMQVSSFQKMVVKTLQELTADKVESYIKENYQGEWDGHKGGYVVDEKIKEAVKENISDIFTDIIGNAIDHKLRMNNQRFPR